MASLSAVLLSEDELSELDGFLLSAACDEDTLSVDEAHGLLSALVAGPAIVDQDEWLEAIWGRPDFSDAQQRQRMTSLLVGMYDEIRETLQQGRTFEPLAVEVEDDGEFFLSYEGWCFGFMLGVEMRQTQWERMEQNEQGLLAPIAQLALIGSEEEPDMDDEEYADWVELLPGAVAGLYAFWRSPQGQRVASGASLN